MKIIVLGAGAWGTAVAMSAAQHPSGHAVTLWARDAAQAAQMQTQRHNARYLPGITLPPSLTLAHGDFATLWPGADLVIVATPMAALRGMLQALLDDSVDAFELLLHLMRIKGRKTEDTAKHR